jgi:hypothetical protein
MTLFRNFMVFVFLFLPLTLVMGLVCDFFVGPIEPTRLGYEVQLYYLHVFRLLVPSIIAVPVLHFLYRSRARTASIGSMRALAVIATPLALLGVHLAIFGTAYWSIPLVMLFALPGALCGYCFGIVRPPEVEAHSST